MKLIRKIAISIVLLASIFTLVSLLLPGKVIAIKVEAKTLSTKQIIAEVFGEDANEAIAIARCESSLNPKAINHEDAKLNGYSSKGLFQLSGINGVLKNWEDPMENAKSAHSLFTKHGWYPWYNCGKKIGLL